MKEYVNWGIIATGWIAEKFAAAATWLSNNGGKVRIAAVASRSADKAAEFAGKWNIPKSYGSYEQLFNDPEIDAVYIGTPHTFHAQLSVQALLSGKHVLCEKPAAINTKELQAVVSLAEEKKLFFMEAFWTAFNPTVLAALKRINEGCIGKVVHSHTVFNNRCKYDLKGRMYNPDLAGGALLDLGIYSLAFSMMIAQSAGTAGTAGGFGTADNFYSNGKGSSFMEPRKGTTAARIAGGVDLWNSTTLTFPNGITGVAESAMDFSHPNNRHESFVYGEKGYVHFNDFFYSQKAEIFLYKNDEGSEAELAETVAVPFDCNGYEYEIKAATEKILEGKTECENHTSYDALVLCKLMDSLRAQWRFEYSFEKTNYENLVQQILCETKANAQSAEVIEQEAASETDPDEILTIYTDGGCSGNPGPGGWGAVIIDGTKETLLSGGEESTTNNKMELTAAIQALAAAAQNIEWRARKILVYSDSQYVKNGITDWIKKWKQNGWKTANKKPVLNKELWEELDELYSSLNIEWAWVKGHAGVKYNEICDELCQKEIRKFQ